MAKKKDEANDGKFTSSFHTSTSNTFRCFQNTKLL